MSTPSRTWWSITTCEFSNGSLQQEVRQLAEEARRELARYFIRPAAQLADEEAYTVFCIDSPLAAEDGAAVERRKTGWPSTGARWPPC